ncbi:riboflavin kinase/FAD synthetase [Thalassiosira pseudonana CCMP1335]|uniref:riboflavin kinase n=1 Tax=Thalassiosira pseudonana TaxID=35128 RepID=B8C967_THAPS|nr:riboflavin kinase/FAD synthetase [Thalassiosira pseudonana CCMP1335]EED89997.1 riboflavin kinase/FAD synthetase [Thalassiosira pseudonana CCMP1335]
MKEQLPIRIVSRVVRGFGRGSKDLGIPTANVSREEGVYSCSSSGGFDALPTGIYWGFARIFLGRVHKAAISVGFNPTYNNKQKTVEPHLIAEYGHPQRHASSTKETLFQDFYDRQIVLSLVGYLRPELPFEGLEKLTAAIKKDIEDAERHAKGTDATTLGEREWVASSSVI